jgi:hypothetical protein
LDVTREELESWWGRESEDCVRKFGEGRGAHLYPYVDVEGGVRTRFGVGKLLSVLGGIGRVLHESETEELPDATVKRRKPISRDVRVGDIYPACVSVDEINASRRQRRARRARGVAA